MYSSLILNLCHRITQKLSNFNSAIDSLFLMKYQIQNLCFENISTAISEVAIKTLTTKTSCKPEWMSCNTKKAIDNKHKTRKSKGTSSTEYKVAKAESKKLVKKDGLNQVEKDMVTLK